MREMDETGSSYWLEELTEALACHQWPGLEMCGPPSKPTPARAAPAASTNVSKEDAKKSKDESKLVEQSQKFAEDVAGVSDPRLANAVADVLQKEGISSDDEREGMGMAEFEGLLREIQNAHHEASDLTDEQRKARAERLGMQMCKLLGESDDDDSAYEDEAEIAPPN